MYYSLPAQLFPLACPPVCPSCSNLSSPLYYFRCPGYNRDSESHWLSRILHWVRYLLMCKCKWVMGWGDNRNEEFPLISDEWFNCWCISVLKEIGDLTDPNSSSHILLQFVGFLLAKCACTRYLHCSTLRGGLCDKANQHPLSIHHSNQVYGSQSMHASNSCKALDWDDKINWLNW